MWRERDSPWKKLLICIYSVKEYVFYTNDITFAKTFRFLYPKCLFTTK